MKWHKFICIISIVPVQVWTHIYNCCAHDDLIGTYGVAVQSAIQHVKSLSSIRGWIFPFNYNGQMVCSNGDKSKKLGLLVNIHSDSSQTGSTLKKLGYHFSSSSLPTKNIQRTNSFPVVQLHSILHITINNWFIVSVRPVHLWKHARGC